VTVDSHPVTPFVAQEKNSDLLTGSLDFTLPALPPSPSRSYPYFPTITVTIPDDSGTSSVTRSNLIRYVKSSCSGFFDGTSCKPCPEGGTCGCGGVVKASKGYWCQNVDDCGTSVPIQCANSLACPGSEASLNEAAIGQAALSCLSGYEGVACTSCSQNYYKTGTSCVSCGDTTELQAQLKVVFVGAGAWFFVLALCITLMTPYRLASCVNALMYLQLIAVLCKKGSEQVTSLQGAKVFFDALSFLNFDMDLVKPGCSIPVLSYGQYLGMTVAMFSVNLVTSLVGVLLKGMWERRKEQLSTRTVSPVDELQGSNEGSKSLCSAVSTGSSPEEAASSKSSKRPPPHPEQQNSLNCPDSAVSPLLSSSSPPPTAPHPPPPPPPPIACAVPKQNQGIVTLPQGDGIEQTKKEDVGVFSEEQEEVDGISQGCKGKVKHKRCVVWCKSSPHHRRNPEHVESFGWKTNLKFRAFHALLIVLSIWHLRITAVSVVGIQCVSLSSDDLTLVMRTEKTLKCYVADHVTTSIFCWAFVLLYSAGFPCLVYVLLKKTHHVVTQSPDLHHVAIKDMRLGYLFNDLDMHHYWFRTVVLLCNLILTVINSSFSDNMVLVFSAGTVFAVLKLGVVGIFVPFDKWFKNIRQMLVGFVVCIFVSVFLSSLVEQAVAQQVWVINSQGDQVLLKDPELDSKQFFSNFFVSILVFFVFVPFIFHQRRSIVAFFRKCQSKATPSTEGPKKDDHIEHDEERAGKEEEVAEDAPVRTLSILPEVSVVSQEPQFASVLPKEPVAEFNETATQNQQDLSEDFLQMQPLSSPAAPCSDRSFLRAGQGRGGGATGGEQNVPVGVSPSALPKVDNFRVKVRNPLHHMKPTASVIAKMLHAQRNQDVYVLSTDGTVHKNGEFLWQNRQSSNKLQPGSGTPLAPLPNTLNADSEPGIEPDAS